MAEDNSSSGKPSPSRITRVAGLCGTAVGHCLWAMKRSARVSVDTLKSSGKSTEAVLDSAVNMLAAKLPVGTRLLTAKRIERERREQEKERRRPMATLVGMGLDANFVPQTLK